MSRHRDERQEDESRRRGQLPARPGTGPTRPGVDSDELDRVIRRAVELQFSASERDEGGRLSEAEVLRIGREVGLEPRYVRRALGELRAEALIPAATKEHGLSIRLFGRARLQAARVVPGRPAEVAARLEEYLRVGESLHQVRKRGHRSRWEAEPGFMAQLQRGLRWGGRPYQLARATFVEVNLEELEEGYCLTVLEADLSSVRSGNGWGWVAGGAGGGLAAGVGVGVGLGLPVVGVPVAGLGLMAGALLGRREYAKEAERIRLSMEGILDRLEAGEPLLTSSPSLRDRLSAG